MPSTPDPDLEAPTTELHERPETGVAEIDEVTGSIDELEGRPVEEHVGAYESAHERLRRALDTP